MKKFLSLITLLVTAMAAFAQTFTDKSTVSVGGQASDMAEAKLEVADNGDGTYNVTFKDVVNLYNNYNDAYGDVGFNGLTATTEGGITTLSGSALTATTFTGAGHGYIPGTATIENANVVVKYNADKAYATLEAKYKAYVIGNGSSFNITFGTDEFNSTPEPPVTGVTKLVADGLAPNGTVIPTTPFTINWETQKIVANLDMTNQNVTNCNTLSFSDNEADVSQWNVANGYTLHFFYTKDDELWTATGWMTAKKTFTIQFRNNADLSTTPTAYVEVDDPANVNIEITKEGVFVDGTLQMSASQIEAFYSKPDLYFGCSQGDARTYAVYKNVQIETVGGEDPKPEFPTPADDAKQYTDNFVVTAGGEAAEPVQATAYVSATEVENVVDIQIDKVSAFGVDTKINITGVAAAEVDGYTMFQSEEVKMMDESGNTYNVFVAGQSKGDKLFLQIATNEEALGLTSPEFVFGDQDFPEEPKEDGGLIESGYQPAGKAWTQTATIDWDKQYVKAVIDLSTCQNAFENILSVGASISGWDNAAHYHFYYSPATTSLQFNGMAPDNKSRYDITAEGTVTIEISKKNGLVIDGTQYLNQYNTASQYGYDEWVSAMGALWQVSDIEFGACQGSVMSNATYKYFNVLDLPAEPVTVLTTKSYTDKLVSTDANTSEETTVEEFKIDLNTMSDGTAQVVLNDFPLTSSTKQTLVFACSSIEETANENGTKTISFNDSECEIDGVKCGLFGKARENTDGTLYWTFVIGQNEGSYLDVASCTFGTNKPVTGISGINAEIGNGNAQVFSIGGAKMGGLQKGVNIVRTANGKTVKVLK